MHLSIRFRHKATSTASGDIKESLIVLERHAACNRKMRMTEEDVQSISEAEILLEGDVSIVPLDKGVDQ